jgi:integrase
MATFQVYRTADGKKRFLAVVRIKGFNPTSEAFDSQKDAKDWADTTERDLRGKRDRGGARADVTTLTVANLAVAYLADPKVRQLRTIAGIESLIAAWVDEYGATRVRAFGYLQIVAFRDKLLGTGLKPGRVNRYLSAMRKCWNWGNPHYVQTPWPQKIMLEEPKPEAINDHYGTSEATVDDVHAVTWRDVDSKAGTVMIRGQKTQRPQRVAMLAPAVEGLARAAKLKNIADPRVFWQFKDIYAIRSPWDRARKKFPEKMTKLRLHDCRHLCASFLAANGASNVELMSQLGHKSLSMVARYAHLAGGHRGAAHDKMDAAFSALAKK